MRSLSSFEPCHPERRTCFLPEPRDSRSFASLRMTIHNWAENVLKSGAKNLGDAHRVPFVVACCRCLVLLGFLLCFLFGCHGSILPFHSSWNFATVFCCNCLNL